MEWAHPPFSETAESVTSKNILGSTFSVVIEECAVLVDRNLKTNCQFSMLVGVTKWTPHSPKFT